MSTFYDKAGLAARSQSVASIVGQGHFASEELPVPDIVNAVLLRDGCVLLARRSAVRKAYPGLWSFPGGHVEPGEDFEQALHRELGEEVGIVPAHYRPLAPIADPHAGATTYRMFAVTAWRGEPSILDHEHSELRWVPLDAATALDDLALDAYRRLFDELGGVQP